MKINRWLLGGMVLVGVLLVTGRPAFLTRAAGKTDDPIYVEDVVKKTVTVKSRGQKGVFPMAYYAADNNTMNLKGLKPLAGNDSNALSKKEVAFRDPLHKDGIVYMSFNYGTSGYQAVSTDGHSYQLVMNGSGFNDSPEGGGVTTTNSNLVYAEFANREDYLIGIPQKKPLVSVKKMSRVDGSDWSDTYYAGFSLDFIFDQGQVYVTYMSNFGGDRGTKEKVYERGDDHFPTKNFDPEEFAKTILQYVPSDDARAAGDGQ